MLKIYNLLDQMLKLAQSHNLNEITALIEKTLPDLQEYNDSFANIVILRKDRKLNKNEGLQGIFRDAATDQTLLSNDILKFVPYC